MPMHVQPPMFETMAYKLSFNDLPVVSDLLGAKDWHALHIPTNYFGRVQFMTGAPLAPNPRCEKDIILSLYVEREHGPHSM